MRGLARQSGGTPRKARARALDRRRGPRTCILLDRYQKAISQQGSDSSTQQESFDANAWCEATKEPSRGRVYGFSIYKPVSSIMPQYAWCEATGEPSRGRVYGFSIYKSVSSIMPQYASQRHIGASRYCSMIEEEVQRRVEIACLHLEATVNAQHE
ncbi:hypothetical protein AXF42_Ash004766 [Apostasia shenzhenica]|uniref:Uncharacterized protein n=1 Tax=Apostasia shenzhenica TaxID=1088818 RepID=A0A2I0BHK2_9ASPA|nr:hypothetical protein AXF42_Ash004766 [Apostasia shenzhenica]